MQSTQWQILLVDDDKEIRSQIKEFFEGESLDVDGRPITFQVETLSDFSHALDMLQARQVDILILDVRLGSYDGQRETEAGIRTLEEIKSKCFVPVIFYTGLSHLVNHLETPFIHVVSKTEMPRLLEVVEKIFASGLPTVNRALIRHVEAVQRDYMWEFVAQNWQQYSDTPDRAGLAYLLARRLAASLSGPGIQELMSDLGSTVNLTQVGTEVHPMEYYIMPPMESAPMAGDIYKGTINGRSGYWILLTPSCDMVTGRVKADWSLLAYCTLLTDEPEYQNWLGSPNRFEKPLQALLRNSRQGKPPERFYFLPGAIKLPNLVVDFQQLVTVSFKELIEENKNDEETQNDEEMHRVSLEKLASLDSPFAEALLARFTRYFGRLGTPDLDVNSVISRLRT